MWGQLLSAGIQVGGSLLGGLFGRKDEKRRERAALAQRNWEAGREDTQIQRMVEDAKAAGINPLTAIRGGHSAGYAQTHMPTIGRSAIANAIGNVGVGIGNAFQSAFDHEPINEERAHLELEIQRAHLRNMNADTARMLSTERTATGATRTQHAPTLGGTAEPEVGRNTVTNPWATDTPMHVTPNWQDAEMWETRYGDLIQEGAGALTLGADLVHNLGRGFNWANNRVRRAHNLTPSIHTVDVTEGW